MNILALWRQLQQKHAGSARSLCARCMRTIVLRAFVSTATSRLSCSIRAPVRRGFSHMALPPQFKVALIQLAVGADKAANLSRASDKIAEAAAASARLVMLPECFNCPYGGKYFPDYADVLDESSPTWSMLATAAKSNAVWLVGGSVPERDGDKLYNTSLIFDPEGRLVGKHRKIHLFDISIPGGITFKESDTLSPGSDFTVVDLGCAKMGVGICYDARFPELAQAYRHQAGCQLLVYPGAFNMTTGPRHWELIMRSRANDNQVYVLGCSPARDTAADYVAWGHSMLVDPWAVVQASATDGECIVYGDVDLSVVAAARAQVPTSLQRRTDLYSVTAPKLAAQ